MNRYERRRQAIDKSIGEHITAYQKIYKKAEEDDRDPSEDERLEIESELKAIETLKTEKEDVVANIKTLEDVERLGREIGPAVDASVLSEPHDRMFNGIAGALPINAPRTKSLGQSLVESAGYKAMIGAYKETGRVPANFSTGVVGMETKGTLTEGLFAPGSGSGGGLIPVPQVIPGVVEQLFQPLTFESLLLAGQASVNAIRYVVEGTATSAAAATPEAGTKPESALGVGATDEPIRKVATMLPIAEEMLEDAPAVQAYINGRLQLFVQIEVERELFRGLTANNEVNGIFNRPIAVYAGGSAAGNYADQMFKAMNGVRGSAFVEPDFFVVHPNDWQVLRLLKDSAGQYFGGGPFLGPYGGPQGPIEQSGQLTGPVDTLWNKRVYITARIGGPGTALIGTTSAAQVWSRGGLSVEATNSHQNYFALNLIAVRAERRVGLAVYRPAAFCQVNLQ